MNQTNLTIAGVAKASGVGVETVRYYERRGLVSQPKRGLGSFRHYQPDHVRRMRSSAQEAVVGRGNKFGEAHANRPWRYHFGSGFSS